MKRFALKFVMFLLFGTIINVGLAWALARYAHVARDVEISATSGDSFQLEWRAVGLTRKYQSRWFFGPDQTFNDVDSSGMKIAMIGPRLEVETIETHAAGWPMLSVMRSETLPGQFGLGPTQEFRLFVPIKIGFAVNTLFYAAIISGGWLSFAAFGRIRRRRRIKRGLCVRCGYDLRGRGNSGAGTCPECGAAAIAMPDSRKPTAENPQ